MSVYDPERLATSLQDFRDSLPRSAHSYVDAAVSAIETPRRPGLAGPSPPPNLSLEEIAACIDHTQLRPAATDEQIDRLCEEAVEYGFGAACVHPVFVARVADALEDTDVTPCSVVGFPHGANRAVTKAQEAERAVSDGAREIDMVLSLGAVTSGRLADAEADVRAVVTAVRNAEEGVEASVLVKVILETALLSPVQTAVSCVIARRAGADFVKTSTGFASTGARAKDVALMRQIVGNALGVKASGGVGSVEAVERMVRHGARRIGASGSVAIMEEARALA